MIRYIILPFFFVLLIGITGAQATPQVPDILIYEGKEYPVQTDFLNTYFTKFPERNTKNENGGYSALWRGYVAKFEISDGSLFLKDVMIDYFDSPKSGMDKAVPDGKRLKIDWYTGLLLSSYGENNEDPYSLASLDAYEKYSLFEIEAGNFRRVKHFDNKQYHDFRKRQFKAFKKTSEYRETVKKMTADGRLKNSDADANIMLWLVSYTKKFLVE